MRKVPYGESDLIVTFFTEREGTVSAVARAALRSKKRFASLEPMHLLSIIWERRVGSELGTLIEAIIERPRIQLGATLDRIEAAGKALRWIRSAAPPHTPEPAAWVELNRLLDALDSTEGLAASRHLAGTGLRLLMAMGWGLDFERCVRCGRPCDSTASACIDPARGGLVCRACGGARTVLRPDRRAHLVEAANGDDTRLDEADARAALALVDEALAAHAGLEG